MAPLPRKRAWLIALTALVGVAWLAAPAHAATRVAESFNYKKALAPGKTLTVMGINGFIHAAPTAGAEVVVEAQRKGRRDDPEAVKIEVTEDAEGIHICARYPSRDGGLNPCAEQNLRNNDVRVEYEVLVPNGVRLNARTVNGEIEARDLSGPVYASTVNGGVDVTTQSWAKASTVNGSIHVAIRRLEPSQNVEFSTVNGSITLEIPMGVDARLLATTVNGSIETDQPVTVSGRLQRQRLEGTLGRGGPEIRVSTVNGSIDLVSGEPQ